MEILLEMYDELCEKASLGKRVHIPSRLKSKAEDIPVKQLKRRARALEKDMDHILRIVYNQLPGSNLQGLERFLRH